jgi:hypothetical protein
VNSEDLRQRHADSSRDKIKGVCTACILYSLGHYRWSGEKTGNQVQGCKDFDSRPLLAGSNDKMCDVGTAKGEISVAKKELSDKGKDRKKRTTRCLAQGLQGLMQAVDA